MHLRLPSIIKPLFLASALVACQHIEAQNIEAQTINGQLAAPEAPPSPPAAPSPPTAPEAPKAPDPLKLAAIEALMIAPPEQALPIAKRLMNSDTHPELKARTLFILSQVDDPEAHRLLLDTARNGPGELQLEAIRMIAVSGNEAIVSQLAGVYRDGDTQVREAVLQAYMITDDDEAIYQAALDAENDEEFRAAVELLGVMGATDRLKQLRDHPAADESLMRAYAIAGDTDSLLAMAHDDSNLRMQVEAIRSLGIASDTDLNSELVKIYRGSSNYTIKQAVMESLMIAGDDQSVLQLFRSATEDRERADLLRLLVVMDSDAAIEVINAALMEE